MIISVPFDTNFVSTNVVDHTEIFSITTQKTYLEKSEVQYNNKVYYATEDIPVLTYDPNAHYVLGDVVWGEGVNPNQVMYATEGNIPSMPTQYYPLIDNISVASGASTRDHTTWTNRFCNILEVGTETLSNPYEFTITKPDGFTHNYYFQRSFTDAYVRLVVKNASDVTVEFTDARIPVYTSISDLTSLPVVSIQTVTGSIYPSWFPNCAVNDVGGLYIRTHITTGNAVEQFVYVKDAMLFKSVTSPEDIPRFSFIRDNKKLAPFDGNNYNKATSPSPMVYTFNSGSDANMFALGYVKGTSYTYKIGTAPTSAPIPIDASRDEHGVLPDWYTTVIYYNPVDVTIAGGTSITVTIYNDSVWNDNVELGSIIVGGWMDQGMTNLELNNEYKDFSVFEYDPWGNVSYTDRARVAIYSGSVDIPISSYDRLDRLMGSIGKQTVIIDGSDGTTNEAPTGDNNMFAATQKVGRFTSFKQNTRLKQTMLDPLANYSFTFEEIV
jgi:hypothetical protein